VSGVGVLVLAGVGLIGRGSFRPAPPLVLPSNLDQIDPEVASLVRQRVEQAHSDPRSAPARGRLALAYEANGLWIDAASAYEAAAHLAPEEMQWRFHLAIVTRHAGESAAALAMLRALAREHPSFAPLHDRLGSALLEAGAVEEAKESYRRLRELEPRAPEGLVGLADVLLRGGETAEAAALLERAVSIDPSYRSAHYLLGLAYRAGGRREEAARELSLGLEAEPRYLRDPLSDELDRDKVNLTERLARAGAHISEGRAQEAVPMLEAALAARPGNVTVLNNLAVAVMHTGDARRALDLLGEAKRRDPREFSTDLNLASCYLRLGRPVEALRHAEAAVAAAPEVGKAHLTRAGVLVALRRYEEATAALQQAIRLDARSPQGLLMLGEISLRLGRAAQAREAFASAARTWPGLLPAQLGLVRACLDLGDRAGAAAALASARTTAPANPQVAALARQLEQARP